MSTRAYDLRKGPNQGEPEAGVAGAEKISGFKQALLCFFLSIALAGVTILLAIAFMAPKTGSVHNLKLSGRIEMPESRLGALVAGRVKNVLVQEGDPVHKGQLLVRMDDSFVVQSAQDSDERVNSAQALVDRDKAAVDELKRSLALLEQTPNKAADLSRPVVQAPRAVAKEDELAAGQSAESALAKSQITQSSVAQSSLAQFPIAQSQLDLLKREAASNRFNAISMLLTQKSAELCAAMSELQQAKAARRQIGLKKTDLSIYSPIEGVCSSRMVEPGEVAAAGQVLLLVSDPNRTYMRGFLPENQIADVKIGQRAIVYLDSAQGKKILFAKITEIDPKASFTPENVYFPDDRVKQVFGIKMTIRNPDGIPKAGMPCDANIIPGELAE